jgi:hypothetical protein
MSHISRIKTQIVDKGYLLQALKDLGYEVEEGEELAVSGFRGQQAKAELLVKLPLSNDIGFIKNGEGYEIVADWFGVHGIKAQTFSQQVTQRYAYVATRAKLEEQGFALVQESQEKGAIHLVLRRTA